MTLRAKAWSSMFAAAVAILVLNWWILDGSTTRPRVIRSRLTLVVETPEGERSGSSVTQNTTYFAGGLTRAQGWGLTEQLVGEAVVIDLGQRGILFSTFERPSTLSRSGGDAYSAGVTPFPQEKFRGEYSANASINERYAAYLDDLNRLKPKSELLLENVPVLVRFDNLNDPTSVVLVDPLDLAASFGPGVAFKGATVEITDDPITHGIEARLPWLKSSTEAPTLFPQAYLISLLRTVPKLSPVQNLRFTDFRSLPR
jgi:hypothetical protein